ncbi:transglycosylase protein with SLT domain [Humibacillus xanthopallidus]|uniref:Transglycosylase protein with SLT domain n=1 Tax=Humibacillus xanthopallidus TaxID=412689 RepID=A0A543PKG6_9MICO|nr:lytic transglycosylase domain-containing protein [Humibacillus xanthopallidus]TQN44570.1 transglycosylase protein with SLT domain [Humibacillus xanthopallidus]
MRRGGRAATGVALACAAMAASVVLSAAPTMAADGPAPAPTPSVQGDPADPFGPAPGSGDGSVDGSGSGPGSTVGQVTGAVVAPLFDRLRLAAAYVVGSSEPSGAAGGSAASGSAAAGATGAGGAAWKPPTDLRAPKVVSVPAGAANGPASLTTDQLLWAAYVSAAKGGPTSCHMPVTLLAAIGEVESSSLRGRSLDARHDVVPPVIGPALSGNGFAAIRDTDGGRLDGDPVWDHAVGPMQFIPGTWRAWGSDGNGDGVADPQNIEDATLSAARYLCAGGRDLSRAADLARAVLSYNGSQRYLATVIGLMDAMTSGADAAP